MPPRMAVLSICYDRWDFLRRVLGSWKALAGAPEIFVGTYAGDDVPADLHGFHRVDVRADPFHRTRLRNCVASVVRRAVDPEYILVLDADIRVDDPELFVRALEESGSPDYVLDSPFALDAELLFLTPADPERDEPGKRGTHLVRTDFFFDVGGYDQRLHGWGIEDKNLFLRYAALSDAVAYYDRNRTTHLDHGDDLRGKHNPGGLPQLRTMLANLRRHMEGFDARGDAWREDFGYPDYDVVPAQSGAVD